MSCTVQNVAGTLMAAATTDEFKTQAASQPVSPASLNKPFPLGNADMFNHVQYVLCVGLCLQLRNSLLRRFSALAGHRQSCAIATLHFAPHTLKHDPPIEAYIVRG